MTKSPTYIKILIVDDFELDVHAITRQLRSERVKQLAPIEYEIRSAATGHLGLVEAQAFQPDCILLDYGLPDMNGLEFIDSLIEVSGELATPIVMLTGQGDEQIAVNALKRGVHDYLIKGSFNEGQLTWTIFSALEKANLHKQISSKHEELELFASRMAHDILGPLSNLSLYAEYLEDFVDLDEAKSDEHASLDPLNAIMSSIDHIVEMVEAFRDYASVGRTQMTFGQVNLNSIIDHILLLLRAEIDSAGAQISVDPLPLIIGDTVGLGQLLQNLISNALKYCSKSPQIKISAVKLGSKWQIRVSDNGIGIDNADQIHDQLFEPFVRNHTRTQYPGAGIGLATCHKIVEQHGGEIWFSSTPKQGTTFYFTLDQDLDMELPPLEDHLIENLALLNHSTISAESEVEWFRRTKQATPNEQQIIDSVLPNKHADGATSYYH